MVNNDFNIMNMDVINIFDSYEDNHLYPRKYKKSSSHIKISKGKKYKKIKSSGNRTGSIIAFIIIVVVIVIILACVYYIIKKKQENKKKNVVSDGGEECENVVVDNGNNNNNQSPNPLSNDTQNSYPPNNGYSPVMTNQNQIPNLTGLSTEPTVPVDPDTITNQNQIPNLTGLSTEPTVPVDPDTITSMPTPNTEADK